MDENRFKSTTEISSVNNYHEVTEKVFCLTTPSPLNIELSSSGQNNISTSEIATNPLSLELQ